MKIFFTLSIFALLLSLPFANLEAKNYKHRKRTTSSKETKSQKSGLIELSVHAANGKRLVQGYGFSVYEYRKKKLLSTHVEQKNYRLKLRAGSYDIAIIRIDAAKNTELLTWYRKVSVLPRAVVHKKLFIDHLDPLTEMKVFD